VRIARAKGLALACAVGWLMCSAVGCERRAAVVVEPEVSQQGTADTDTETATRKGIGRTIADWRLVDDLGKDHALKEWEKTPYLVVAFLGTECPLARLYGMRLSELASEYADRGVEVVGVFSNQQDSLEKILEFTKQYKISFATFKDPGNVVADLFEATRTPEVFVLDGERKVRYAGRIDNEHGIRGGSNYRRGFGVERYLEAALEALLAGQAVTADATEPVGCLIGRQRAPQAGSEVTWSRQISRIFQRRCQQCHREGEIAPFELLTYEQVVGWAPTIEEVVLEKRMPPWGANPKYGHFRNDMSLNEEELAQVVAWARAGAPEGDPAELPAPVTYPETIAIPNPDRMIYMTEEPIVIPARGAIEYQYFTVDPGFSEDVWLAGAEARPGSKGVVHHMAVYGSPPGDFFEKRGVGEVLEICGYVPGMNYSSGAIDVEKQIAGEALEDEEEPVGTMRIPAGWQLVFEMHYTANGIEQMDRSAIALEYGRPPTEKREEATAAAPAEQEEAGVRPTATLGEMAAVATSGPRELITYIAQTGDIAIPPFAANHPVDVWQLFTEDVLLERMHCHMHWRGKSFRFTAHYPDCRQEILLDIPRYDFDWQFVYGLAEPKLLPRGTRVHCEAIFDNSEENFRNPNPAATVTYGQQTWQEMMAGFFKVLRRIKDPGEAEAASRDLLAGYPTAEQVDGSLHDQYYYQRGIYREAQQDHAGALADYAAALQANPQWGEVHRTRGALLARLNQANEALADYSAAIALDGDDAKALLGRAELLQKLGRAEEAFLDFDRAVQLVPYNPVPWFERAQIWEKAGDAAQALADYTHIIERVDPGFGRAYRNRGLLRMRRGAVDEGLADLAKTVEIEPQRRGEIDYQTGMLYLQQGKAQAAVPLLQSAVERMPSHVAAREFLASALFQAGDLEGAYAQFEKAGETDTKNPLVFEHLAWIRMKQERMGEALAHFRRALACEPGNPRLMNGVAWVLATDPGDAVRNGKEAVQLAEAACRVSEFRSEQFLDTLAAAYAEAGQFDRAVETAQRAMALCQELGKQELAASVGERLQLYREKRPYRQAAKGEGTSGSP
jgi:tetratricopeptide (TPR) repeat protein/peroxiredoxin/mono/diheme cytochrome c family protein